MTFETNPMFNRLRGILYDLKIENYEPIFVEFWPGYALVALQPADFVKWHAEFGNDVTRRTVVPTAGAISLTAYLTDAEDNPVRVNAVVPRVVKQLAPPPEYAGIVDEFLDDTGAGDAEHPNAIGHAVIADTWAAAIVLEGE